MKTFRALALAPLVAAVSYSSVAGAQSDAAMDESAVFKLRPDDYVWNDTVARSNPLTIVVSIPDQRAYVYRGRALIAATAVSTGKAGKATPPGTYQILEKHADHYSNIYNNAPMPYMQRLTWGGIAIHAGKNPGFPNSHGCIRVPTAFAKKLFAATRLGTTVLVTHESAA